MPSTVYMICNAYESGYGKGQDGMNVTNPYKKGKRGSVDGSCYEAWDIGYKAGREKTNETS